MGDSGKYSTMRDSVSASTSSMMQTAGCRANDLRSLMEKKGSDAVDILNKKYNGAAGLCQILGTSPTEGLSGAAGDIARRKEQYGANIIPPKPSPSFMSLVGEALSDVTLIILIVAAIVSIGLSFYHSPNETDTSESTASWVEGVAILVAVIVVVMVTSINNWQKDRQFASLHKKMKGQQLTTVLRSGQMCQLQSEDMVVGDIAHIKYGDLLQADGIVIHSNDLKLDESSLTGESDHIKKSEKENPVLLSGTYVMEGSGRMVVTAVGLSSQAGIIMELLGASEKKKGAKNKRNNINKDENKEENSSPERRANKVYPEQGASDKTVPVISVHKPAAEHSAGKDSSDLETIIDDDESEDSSRQCCKCCSKDGDEDKEEEDGGLLSKSILSTKLTKLALQIGYAGTAMAVLTMMVLTIRFCVETFVNQALPWDSSYIQDFVSFFILGITVLVVAVPEGLPLSVTISLAYSVKRMMHDNNMVRHLDACETMGNATAICSDKTGTLTTNKMTVTQGYFLGKHYRDLSSLGNIPEEARELITTAISINTSYSSRLETSKEGELKQIGNKTECALLGFVTKLGKDYEKVRQEVPEDKFVKVYTFNSARKSMSTVIAHGSGLRLFTKGASEIVLQKCSRAIGEKGEVIEFPSDKQKGIMSDVIEPMAGDGLRTICLAYKDFNQGEQNWDDEDRIFSNLTFICLFGIQDPVRAEVPAAIRKCQRAGITVRMVTGDNVETARSIATECGLLPPGGDFLVLDGKEFNERIRDAPDGPVNQDKLDEIWPKLRVLARSSPTDKYVLVKGIIDSKLNPDREIVAVTGDGTNDGPALKAADVGFAMGIAGTDVAKEASDIILTDDNFNSIVKAVMWGRNIYDSISKFLQFQLTVNIVAVTVAFVGSCIIRESPLRAIQMLWVNLLMDTLASLALATEGPTEALLWRKPYGRSQRIISNVMFKNIICHSIYQLIVIFCLLFLGQYLLDIDSGLYAPSGSAPSQHFTVVYNTFVMMTLFNEINARKINGDPNVFEGIHRNIIFILIWIGTFAAQVLIVEFGSVAFSTAGLTIDQWIWCLFFGALELLWGQIVSLTPLELMCRQGTVAPAGVDSSVSVCIEPASTHQRFENSDKELRLQTRPGLGTNLDKSDKDLISLQQRSTETSRIELLLPESSKVSETSGNELEVSEENTERKKRKKSKKKDLILPDEQLEPIQFNEIRQEDR